MSVTLVAESVSLVFQNDILLPFCPVAIVELFLCLHVDKSVHTPGHAPTWLLLRQRRECPSSWSLAPSSRGWFQKRYLFTRGSTLYAEGSISHVPIIKLRLRYNCIDFFDCSRCGESCPRDSTHILHQG